MSFRLYPILLLSLAALGISSWAAEPSISALEQRWQKTKNPGDLDSIQSLLIGENKAILALAWETQRPVERQHIPGALLRAWKIRQAAGGSSKADSLFAVIASRYPADREFYVAAAHSPQWIGQPSVSADYLAVAALLDPASSRLWAEAALRYKNAWDAAQAIIALSEWNKSDPAQLNSSLDYLSNFCQSDSGYFRIADSLLIENPLAGWLPSSSFRFRWSLLRSRWDQALSSLSMMEQDSLFHVYALDFAGHCFSANRPDLARNLRTGLRNVPAWALERWRPFEARMAQNEGDLKKAESLLNQQWTALPSAATALQYARFLLAKQDFRLCFSVCRQGIALDPVGPHAADLFPLAVKAGLFSDQADMLEELFKKWENLTRGREFLRSSFFFHKGKTELARGRFVSALNCFQKSTETAKGPEANDAIEWISLFSDLKSDTVLWGRIGGAYILSEKGQSKKAADSLSTLIPQTFGHARNTLTLWATDWYVRAKAGDQALNLLKSESEQCSSCDRILIQLARILLAGGDRQAAHKVYEDFLIRFPQSVLAGEAQRALRTK